MSCSFCRFTGHNVTNCQSTELLTLLRQIKFNVNKLKQSPLTRQDSVGLFLHRDIFSMTMNKLKAIACKLNIKISKKNKDVLVSSIVRTLWFGEEANLNISTTSDLIYLNNLNRIINGVDPLHSWREYHTEIRNNDVAINNEIRVSNINRLIRMKVSIDQLYDSDISQFLQFTTILETNYGIMTLFGLHISLHDILEHIPIIRSYTREAMDSLQSFLDQIRDFEDVVHEQKLDVTCEYVKDLEKTEEEECAICYSDTKCDTILNCGHMYCIDCVVTNVTITMNDHRKKLTCPMCRAETKIIKSIDNIKIENLSYLLK